MINLTVDNSFCRIEGLTPEQFQALRKILSYRAAPEYGSPVGGFSQVRYLLGKRGDFPTGLLYLVQGYLKKSGFKASTNDLRKRPVPFKGLFRLDLGHTPYPEQLEASRACSERGRGIVVAPTGVGKSAIAALIINALQVPTLIVVPTLELKRQLTEGLGKAFGPQKVGSICDKMPIAVENVDALDPKEVLEGYDCVILDEFHHSGAKTYRSLNKTAWKNVYYKFGLTATPFRSQDHERLLLESVLSEVIYQIDYQMAVDKGYIVPMEVYFYDLPVQKVEGYQWREVYSELVVKNQPRNELIARLLRTLADSKTSTLCLVKEIAHGKTLQELQNGGYFANGQDEDTKFLIQLFNQGKLPVLIGTTGVLGEGVDTKPAEFIIIAGLGKSKNAFMQQCGRGFRRHGSKETCKIILFRDKSHKWTLNHFKAQVKYLKDEYGVKPVLLPWPLKEKKE